MEGMVTTHVNKRSPRVSLRGPEPLGYLRSVPLSHHMPPFPAISVHVELLTISDFWLKTKHLIAWCFLALRFGYKSSISTGTRAVGMASVLASHVSREAGCLLGHKVRHTPSWGVQGTWPETCHLWLTFRHEQSHSLKTHWVTPNHCYSNL